MLRSAFHLSRFSDRTEFNRALLDVVDAMKPDLIVLAGFLVVIPPEMMRKYATPYHQYTSVSDPVFLRDWILWTEST